MAKIRKLNLSLQQLFFEGGDFAVHMRLLRKQKLVSIKKMFDKRTIKKLNNLWYLGSLWEVGCDTNL